jgi:molybdopterin molybdotransferase
VSATDGERAAGGGPLELERARRIVLERATPLAAERVPLREALGRRLAEDVVAAEPVPGFDGSAMDGFALRAADTRGARPAAPAALRLAGESRAGHPAARELGAGEAIAISTGAVLPAGADAVVRVEETRREEGRVLVEAELEPGSDVRRAGEDIAAGARALAAGETIGPAQLGVLASLGAVEVACGRRPRVAVLTSGDELLELGEAMRPGGVRNSNAYTIAALAERAGAEASFAGSPPDDLEATRAAIAPALKRSDAVLLCGGVSVGEHDHVKRALAELGVEQAFWRVALKPGKPTWFGTRGETLVFGLPGNPVSALVAFVLLARPALIALAGGRPERRRTVARLAGACEKRPGRTHALRCRLELREDGWLAHPAPRQGSHVLSSMLGADCLALLPAASGPLPAGARVEVELLDRC